MKEFLHLTQLRDRSSRWLAWTAVLAVSLGGVWLCQHRGAGGIEPDARSTPNSRWQVAEASMAGPPAAPLFPPATSALAAVGHQAQPYQTLRQLDLSGPPSPLSASLTTGVSTKPNVHAGGLRFEPNVGQTDRRVQFLTRGRGGAVFLCGRETVLALGNQAEGRSAVLISSLIGSGPIHLQGEAPTGEQVAYLTGNRPEQWKTGVETMNRVRAANVYPGIDAVWYGREGELEYDLELAPGAAPEHIGLRFTGAESVRLDREGALVFRLGAGEVRQSRPVAWQERNGKRELVAVRYEMTGPETIAFRLGAYDRSRPLVIDPIISYSSFAGGLGADRGYAVAVDGAGAAYLTGMTRSADFPGATGTPGGSLDAFVTKLNPDGSGPVWSLYLGGSGADQGAAIAVDAGGVIVAGTSDSPNFPLVTPLQGTPGGGLDAFVVKVKPDGSGLLWGTLLGGRQMDQANGVALAPNGDVVVTGATDSSDFPTLQAAQATFGGRRDAFLTRLAGDGNALLNSTYLGGSGIDLGYGVAVDADGTAVVAGNTTSPNFPTLQAVQAIYGGGSSFFGDGFVATVTPAGALGFSSYYGGADQDTAFGVAVRNGTATVVGMTRSLDFPVRAGRRGKTAGGSDAFILTLRPGAASGSQVVATAFLGGGEDDEARAVALDATGRAVVAGWTVSPDFPLVRPIQTVAGGNQNKNAFVARLATDGQTLVESTYLGGGNHDRAYGVAVDGNGAVYVTGNTQSGDFPIKNAFQGTLRGPEDGFVVKLGGCSLPVTPAILPVVTPNVAYSQPLAVTGGTSPYTLQFLSGNLPTGIFFDSFNRRLSGTTNVAGGTFSFTFRMADAAGCVDEQTFTLVVGNCPAFQFGAPSLNPGIVGVSYQQTLTVNGGMAPYQFVVTGGVLPSGITLAANGTLSGTPTYASEDFGYRFTVQATDQQGCTGSQEYSLGIICPADTPALSLTPDSLPDGIVGQNYGPLTFTGSGGNGGPYTITMRGTSGGDGFVPPPPGLTMSSTGILSGTPTSAGSHPFEVVVRDRNGCFQAFSRTLQVACGSLSLTPAGLPAGSLGTPYVVSLAGQGGIAPYRFTLANGSLPAGLTLSAEGMLAGTPTQGGTYQVSIRMEDASEPAFNNGEICSVTRDYTLVIACTGYAITPASLPGGSYNDPYDLTLTLTNGAEPVTWQVVAGTLPGGLSLGYFGGQLAGAPLETGNFSFTVQATDANGCQALNNYTLHIGGCAPMSLYAPPEGQVGVAYNQTLTASGAAAPYSYSLTGGTLPAGLTLAPDGRLTGTPTTSQTANFTVRVTDANACTQSFDLTVNIVKVVNTSFGLQVLATNYDPTPSAEFVGDFTIQTRLTNTGTSTVNGPLFFQVTALQSIPPGYVNRLKSADNAYGTVGDRQTVTYSPIAPNETADVSFLIGVAGERVPFQFLVDLYGVLEGTSPRSLGRFSFTLTANGLVGPKGIPVVPPAAVAAAEETPDKLLSGGRGAQTNPALAVDPQNPLRMAMACDNGADGYRNKTVTVQVTVDGGKTWRAVEVAKRIGQTQFDTASGATLGYGPDGNLYLAYVLANAYNGENALALTRLTDRLTFEVPQYLTRLTATERAYDCRPMLARRGTEWFLVWERVVAKTNERQLWLASVFGAKGPGTPVLVTKGYVTHPTLALGLDGSLTVGWHTWEPGKATSGGRIQCRTSRDGETWDDIVAVSPSNLGYGRVLPAMPEEEVTPDFKLVADPLVKGRLTGVFTVFGRRSDLLVVRSEDGGQTWSPPQPVMADPAGADQFLPWLGVDAKGTIWVTWYDTRQSPTQEKVDLYQSRSSDGGKTFSEPERVTSGSSDDSHANSKRDRTMNLGNRLGGGLVNGVPVLVWTDTRSGDEDVYWLKK